MSHSPHALNLGHAAHLFPAKPQDSSTLDELCRVNGTPKMAHISK